MGSEPWSSSQPMAATAMVATVKAPTVAAPGDSGSSNRHAGMPTRAPSTMPMPPPRGVGIECERRRPGVSSMPRRWA